MYNCTCSHHASFHGSPFSRANQEAVGRKTAVKLTVPCSIHSYNLKYKHQNLRVCIAYVTKYVALKNLSLSKFK